MEPFTLFTAWYFTYGFVLVESLSLRIYELTDGFDSFQMPQTSLPSAILSYSFIACLL